MKLLVLSALIFLISQAHGKALFQPHLDHEQAHELTWVFTQPVKDWGKTSKDLVKLTCGETTPDFDVKWNNATTFKITPKKNFDPGQNCSGELVELKEKFSFSVPKATVLEVLPWNFDSLEEDSSFVLTLDAQVSPALVEKSSYVEVDGMSEKVELTVVEGEKKVQALKAIYREDSRGTYVLAPKRNFPVSRRISFVVKEDFAHAYNKEGKIRDPFSAKATCDRTNASAPCSPLGRIGLEFTNEVPAKYLADIRLVSGKKEWKPELSENVRSSSYVSFKLKLEADTEYKLIVPSGIRDENDRELMNVSKFPVKMRTGSYPPLAKFPGSFGILESEIGPVLPVTVRNIEKEVSLKKTTAVIAIKNPILIMQWRQAIEKRQHQGWSEETEFRHKSSTLR